MSTTGIRSIWEIRVLSGSHEPEESDDDEVEDGGLGDALVRVVEVEDEGESADDGEVCRVDTTGGVVFVAHGLEESLE